MSIVPSTDPPLRNMMTSCHPAIQQSNKASLTAFCVYGKLAHVMYKNGFVPWNKQLA
jgi:hypothetical protein